MKKQDARAEGGRRKGIGLIVKIALLAAVLVSGSFYGGIRWERWSRGAATTKGGYTNILLPGKGRQTGRRIPGDFERKAALIVSSEELIDSYPGVFTQVASAVAPSAKMIYLTQKQEYIAKAKALISRAGLPKQSVLFAKASTDTMWIRDYGPVFVKDSKGNNIVMNAEYAPPVTTGERWRDDDFPVALAKWFGLKAEDLPIKMEGGNFLSNGEGLLVSTTKVISQNEELGYDVQKLFAIFNERLGVEKWVYVETLIGEPTGHADVFISFLAPNIVIVGALDKAVDPVNSERLNRAAMALSEVRTARGPLRVYRIPMPPPKGDLWRSYVNSILINGVVLVPTYSDVDPDLEAEALSLYRRLLPTWRVVGINSDALIRHQGALHCISQQVPSGVKLSNILESQLE